MSESMIERDELREQIALVIDPGLEHAPRINLHRARFEEAYAKADAIKALLVQVERSARKEMRERAAKVATRYAERNGGLFMGAAVAAAEGIAAQIRAIPLKEEG